MRKLLIKQKFICSLAMIAAFIFSFAGCSESPDEVLTADVIVTEQTLTGTEEIYSESEAEDTEAQTEAADITVTSAEAASYTEYSETEKITESTVEKLSVEKDGRYTTPEDVADYIHTFGTLPSNFITKKEAQKLGWDSKKGNLWDVTDRMSIGGDHFGNYEGLLPEADGRKYTECDVNYEGGYRGSERIVFSNDGLIFYTDDHYESFTQLY